MVNQARQHVLTECRQPILPAGFQVHLATSEISITDPAAWPNQNPIDELEGQRLEVVDAHLKHCCKMASRIKLKKSSTIHITSSTSLPPKSTGDLTCYLRLFIGELRLSSTSLALLPNPLKVRVVWPETDEGGLLYSPSSIRAKSSVYTGHGPVYPSSRRYPVREDNHALRAYLKRVRLNMDLLSGRKPVGRIVVEDIEDVLGGEVNRWWFVIGIANGRVTGEVIGEISIGMQIEPVTPKKGLDLLLEEVKLDQGWEELSDAEEREDREARWSPKHEDNKSKARCAEKRPLSRKPKSEGTPTRKLERETSGSMSEVLRIYANARRLHDGR
ncbi:uncharacterized protein VTP21DRAFT_1204 [Calcarisporiella thermophila]|uniref:uncharacterized protein n=1 Tax=Calcarisporiella thermophila TaxID=911321 RepID=UPI0037445A59